VVTEKTGKTNMYEWNKAATALRGDVLAGNAATGGEGSLH